MQLYMLMYPTIPKKGNCISVLETFLDRVVLKSPKLNHYQRDIFKFKINDCQMTAITTYFIAKLA